MQDKAERPAVRPEQATRIRRVNVDNPTREATALRPLPACDCDNYTTCNCDHDTCDSDVNVCVGDLNMNGYIDTEAELCAAFGWG